MVTSNAYRIGGQHGTCMRHEQVVKDRNGQTTRSLSTLQILSIDSPNPNNVKTALQTKRGKRKKCCRRLCNAVTFTMIAFIASVSVLTVSILMFNRAESGEMWGGGVLFLQTNIAGDNNFRMVDSSSSSYQITSQNKVKNKYSSSAAAAASIAVSAAATSSGNAHAKKKILTYDRFGGRLNNQIFQFVSALQHATILGRTLVVPPEKVMVDWTGMSDPVLNLWDLDSLNSNYDIDWTTALINPLPVTEECKVLGRDFHNLLTANFDPRFSDCEVLNINPEKRNGLLSCGQQHRFCGDADQERLAYGIYEHLKLSTALADVLRPLQLKRYGLAVHSRVHGNEGPYPTDICLRGNAKTCRSHLGHTCEENMSRANCAMWTDLRSQLPKGLLEVPKFVLASDGAGDFGSYPPHVSANGASFVERTLAKLDPQTLQSLYATSQFKKGRFNADLNRLTDILLDMFALVEPSYLVGNYYSTLSLNACFLRGEERKYMSNMCWMLIHPDTSNAVKPSLEEINQAIEALQDQGRLLSPTSDRVYCMVPYIWTANNLVRYKEIMDTWGKRCNVLRFMIDPIIQDKNGKYLNAYSSKPEGELALPYNAVVINVTRPWNTCRTSTPCRHIWEKMWRSWVWVEDHESHLADWFVKVDWDTFFFPENLLDLIKQRGWKSNEAHYFGHKISHRIPDAIAGAAVVFSRETLRAAAVIYRRMPTIGMGADKTKCVDRADAAEEISTSVCLKLIKTNAEETRDLHGREYFHVDRVDKVLKWNRTEQGEWWFWQGKPKNVGELENCCANRPVSFHMYKQAGALRRLEEQFYGDDGNFELRRLDRTTKRYVEKVRKAMKMSDSDFERRRGGGGGGAEEKGSSQCEWKKIMDGKKNNNLVVLSTHSISTGTAYLLKGDAAALHCGDDASQDDDKSVIISLSDPMGTNHFDVHRIDCPPGMPLRLTSGASSGNGGGAVVCPAAKKPSSSGAKISNPVAKHVICLAPLYNNLDTRWLIEWMLYHEILGFDKVVVPVYEVTGLSKTVLSMLAEKKRGKEAGGGGFVEIVPWGPGDTNDVVRDGRIYERGKIPAWNRCYLDHAMTSDWMLFVDVDEVLHVSTTLQDVTNWMAKNKKKGGGLSSAPPGSDKWGFSLKSKTVVSILTPPEKERLLLDQYSGMEREPICPYNCGEYHLGRWKYFVRGSGDNDGTEVMNEMLWTHSISGLDYERASELMTLVPDRIAFVRHYQAHWYRYEKKHGSKNEQVLDPVGHSTQFPVSSQILTEIKKRIQMEFASIYDEAPVGLSWA